MRGPAFNERCFRSALLIEDSVGTRPPNLSALPSDPREGRLRRLVPERIRFHTEPELYNEVRQLLFEALSPIFNTPPSLKTNLKTLATDTLVLAPSESLLAPDREGLTLDRKFLELRNPSL